MRSGQKLAYGAFLGAFATLVLVPFTRPFIFSGFMPWGVSHELSAPTNLTGDPDLNESAVWVETWAQKIAKRTAVTPKDLEKVTTVVERATVAEPDNAYWWQVLAVLEASQDRGGKADSAWRQASKKPRWNDYQHSRLMARRAMIDPVGHGWSYALAYGQHDYSVVERIQSYARNVIRSAPLESDAGLTRRVETLRNGQLIRNYATSITLGEYGVEMIELAAYPPDLAPINNPSKLILARMFLHDKLREKGRDLDAGEVDASYRSNDGWTAFANSDVALDNASSLSLALLMTTCFGGGMLWASLVGLVFWGLGSWSSRTDASASLWRFPWCVILGVAIGVGTGFATGSALAGAGVFGAFGLLAWRPPRVRYAGDLTLGPLYGFLVLVFGVLITVAVAWLAMGASQVGWSIAAQLPFPDDYYGFAPMVIGLAAIGLGFAISLGPAYGWAYRIDPPRLVSLTLSLMGRRIFATCLMLVVISAPVVVYADRTLGNEMRNIVENEPIYYLHR